jgi:gamma-glutamylputrescine oxidase
MRHLPPTAAAHAPSLYAATAVGATPRPALAGETTADVLVVGAGLTGLSAALALAEAGRSVVVVDANRIAWGASGRNGGQLHSGQRLGVAAMEAAYGIGQTRALFGLAEEAKRHVRDLIDRHAIACDWRPGLIHALHRRRLIDGERREIDHLARHYGVTDRRFLDRAATAAALGSDRYVAAVRDASAGHLHPLNFTLGLAAAAEAAGARIFEATRVNRVVPDGALTDGGRVRAATTLLATNAYIDALEPETAARLMPLNNFLLATEPAPERVARLIPGGEAVADSRFVIYYWRPTGDGRLVFGGGETFSPRFPADIAGFVRPHLLKVYPGLADLAITHAWGGALAVTRSRMPFIRRMRPGLYTAAGYSGHGLGIATLAGRLIAEAILGDTARFDVMAAIPAARFPGGRRLRHPLQVAAMLWFGLLDRL